MNVGIVSFWFNRGQATVARQIRSILDEFGHSTFVLARPTKSKFTYSNFVSNEDVWSQNRVRVGSEFNITQSEYLSWVRENNIEAVFFDQNYQFDEIARLRSEGVKTSGRFVWEQFASGHVDAAKQAFDIIYSLTQCEVERYSNLGIDSPYVRWGCHPEVDAFRVERENKGKSFLYIGGFMSIRKPTAATVKAFREVRTLENELLLKVQRPIRKMDFVLPETIEDLATPRRKVLADDSVIDGDARIKIIDQDMTQDDYLSLFANCDVSLAPSRWEGLGLHLFEAQSLGVPTITCNIPPMSEVIEDGVNGLLVDCKPIGLRENGLMAYEPTIDGLRSAIAAFSDPIRAKDLAMGTKEVREKRKWSLTCKDYLELLTQ